MIRSAFLAKLTKPVCRLRMRFLVSRDLFWLISLSAILSIVSDFSVMNDRIDYCINQFIGPNRGRRMKHCIFNKECATPFFVKPSFTSVYV